ncbi:MAG TPA: GAF domain-containing sensor histidine kinase [Streptosporangiaceae bacterium]|nr:GAF domain-containing sensor histidine kinase [Streptosporangiaceae bacterium]
MSAGLDLEEILRGIASLTTETTQTDVCFVYLLDEAGERLVMRGATPPFHRLAGQVELKMGEGVSGWVAAHGRPAVITQDKFADQRYKHLPALGREDFTSMASVPILGKPIRGKPHRLVGVLNVHTRQRREFTDADVQLLGWMAGLMAGGIENARLHRMLAQREEAMERFAERIVLAQETERRRLAGEIHDGISQRVVSLSFHLSAAADAVKTAPDVAAHEIAEAQSLAEAALDETRFAIAGLHPPVLDDLGLAASLESLAASIPQLEVHAEARPCDLPPHVATSVYRIAQEALQNVVKHAGATKARLRLLTHGDTIILEIEDDGQGFQLEAGNTTSTGYGLPGMRERAELLGGTLEVKSYPGQGTLLRLRFPASQEQSTNHLSVPPE